MLHQVQFYNPRDYAEPEKRQVVATVDGLANETEVNDWSAKILQESPAPDGMQAFVVAENNPWFIRQDETQPLVAINNVSDTANNGQIGEVQLLSYEQCGPMQLAMDEKRRLESFEREERLKQYLKDFKG